MVFQDIAQLFRPMILFQTPAAPKEPDFVEKYKKLSKKAKLIGDTIGVSHHEAYIKAADANLRDSEGQIDYEKLGDDDTRNKFVEDMAKVYQERAKKVLKSGAKPEDQFENELMLQAVYGTSRAELKEKVRRAGKGYNIHQHSQEAEEWTAKVKQRLNQITGAHIEEKHIDDIIKYTKAEEAAKTHGYELAKPAVNRDVALGLLTQYVGEGYLTKPALEYFGTPFFKKAKKK